MRIWILAFPTFGSPGWAVCRWVKATTQLTRVAKLAVFAIGAPEASIKVENAARF